MNKSLVFCAALACSTSAFAAVPPYVAPSGDHTITTLDGSQGYVAPPGESNLGSSATISSSTAIDADGSLQLSGDRNRSLNGNNYTPTANYGTADTLVSMEGSYVVLDGGGNQAGAAGIQSPAFRTYINNSVSGARGELIWEAAYNGGYSIGSVDSLSATDQFWMYLAGCGSVLSGSGAPNSVCGSGTYEFHSLEQWGDILGSNWFVSAFGVGNGGSAGDDFSALADGVALNTTAGRTRYNFAAATAAVPEPATWAMMLLGFGGIGASMRRQRRSSKLAQLA